MNLKENFMTIVFELYIINPLLQKKNPAIADVINTLIWMGGVMIIYTTL